MYRKILVPLDGSELAESALSHVRNIIAHNEGVEVVLFRVCEPPVILADYPADMRTEWEDHVREETAHIQQQCRLYLDETERKLAGEGVKVTAAAGLGRAPEEIIDYAIQNQIDLIVMASHGRSGITRWAFGNTAERVLRSSPVPVLLVRPEK
jgi:nucleotide-binding universal stress UspA family protein